VICRSLSGVQPRMMLSVRRPIATCVLVGATVLATFAVADPSRREATPIAEWRFAALLEGSPIGTHRFVLRAAGNDDAVREVESTARFEVKLLGFVAYRYEHRARERWRGDCMESIVAHGPPRERHDHLPSACDPRGSRTKPASARVAHRGADTPDRRLVRGERMDRARHHRRGRPPLQLSGALT